MPRTAKEYQQGTKAKLPEETADAYKKRQQREATQKSRAKFTERSLKLERRNAELTQEILMLRGMLAAYGHKDDQSLPLAQPYNQLPIMGAQYGQQAEPLAQSFQPQYPIIPQPYIPPMGDQYDQQGHPTPPQTPSSPVAAFDATPLRASADNNGQSSSTGNVQLEREARSLSMPLESFQALAVYGNDTNGPINNGDSVFAPNPEQPLVEFVVQDSSTQPQPNVFDRFFHWSDQDTIIDPAITQEQPQLPTPPPALPTSSDLDDLFEDPSWDAMDFGD